MHYFVKHAKLAFVLVFAAVLITYGYSERNTVTENSFVGKWKSSRTETPLYLYKNGEWDIKTEDGVTLQYGIWEYKNDKIIWSYKVDSGMGQDVNDVMSVMPREFQVMEKNGDITIFKRLE